MSVCMERNFVICVEKYGKILPIFVKKLQKLTLLQLCRMVFQIIYIKKVNYIFNHAQSIFRIFRSDEGIYNTYVIDTDYREWALIMHCAEKPKSNHYLSALMLSRTPTVNVQVRNFLRFDFKNSISSSN